jgi:hypothetical protein
VKTADSFSLQISFDILVGSVSGDYACTATLQNTLTEKPGWLKIVPVWERNPQEDGFGASQL